MANRRKKRAKKAKESAAPPGYRMRCLHVPIRQAVPGRAGPGGETPFAPTPESYGLFEGQVRSAQRLAAVASTWIVRQLATLDPANLLPPGQAKPPQFAVDDTALRLRLRLGFPQIESQTMGCLIQRARKYYFKHRWEIQTTAEESLPAFNKKKRPPLPISKNSFEILWDASSEQILCRIALTARKPDKAKKARAKAKPRPKPAPQPGEKPKKPRKSGTFAPVEWQRAWATVSLVQGEDYLWHTGILRQVIAGTLRMGEPSIRKGRRGDLMLSIPVWCPITPSDRDPDRTVCVTTDPDAFWVVHCQGFRSQRKPVFNEDWLRQRIHQFLAGYLEEDSNTPRKQSSAKDLRTLIRTHKVWRERLMQDMFRGTIREARTSRKRCQRTLSARCERVADQIGDRLHKITKTLATFCAANRVALVLYDDRCKSYVDPFPWTKLRGLLQEKLSEHAIPCQVREEDDSPPSTDSHAPSPELKEDAVCPRLVVNAARTLQDALAHEPGKSSPHVKTVRRRS